MRHQLTKRESDDENVYSNACRCQNDALLFRLEQSEEREVLSQREIEEFKIASQNNIESEKMKLKEEEWLKKEKEYEEKIGRLEKALSAKTKQLLARIRRDC